jgi:hypothetical protein
MAFFSSLIVWACAEKTINSPKIKTDNLYMVIFCFLMNDGTNNGAIKSKIY